MFYYYIKFRAYCPNNPYLVLILWLSLPIDGIFCVVAFLKFYLLYKLLTTAPRHHKKKKKLEVRGSSLLWSLLPVGGVGLVACQVFLVRKACVCVLVDGARSLLSGVQ